MLSDRGIFWWSDTPIPDNQFAPDEAVGGLLTISETGRISIELDGVLRAPEGRMTVFNQGRIPTARSIAGLLKVENKRILAMNLHRNGGAWRSAGLSSENYTAFYCLISHSTILPKRLVRAVMVDLTGYEEWLFLGRLNTKFTSRSLTVRHRTQPDLRFRNEAGSFRLVRDMTVNQEGANGARGTLVRERAWLRFAPRQAMPIAKAVEIYGAMQDFLILLTGSEYQMALPEVVLTSGQRASLYFLRTKSSESAPRSHECALPFGKIEGILGDLFFAWLSARAKLGAGAYLYLATRRGLDIYEEHKFLNLMTGLEAYHRAQFGDGDLTGFKGKVARILAQVGDSRDRSWLKKRLKSLGGPSLEGRLWALLDAVPAPLDEQVLRGFLSECARARNDIAHLGRSSDADASKNPIGWLSVRTAILSGLYHARLLLEIGAPEALVERWLTTGPSASTLAWYLRQARLEVRPRTPTN